MINRLKEISSYTFANVLSAAAPLIILPVTTSQLSEFDYSKLVGGQLSLFYAILIVGFALNNSGVKFMRKYNNTLYGFVDILKLKAILFLALNATLLLLPLALEIRLFSLLSFFEIFNLNGLVLRTKTYSVLFVQRTVFSFGYIIGTYLFIEISRTYIAVFLAFSLAQLFSLIVGYSKLLSILKISFAPIHGIRLLFMKSYRYFISQITGQLYSSIPRLLALNYLPDYEIKVLDVVEKLLIGIRLILSSVTNWLGSRILTGEIKNFKPAVLNIFLIGVLTIFLFYGFTAFENEFFHFTLGLETDFILLVALMIILTGVNILLGGYYYLLKGWELRATLQLIIAIFCVFLLFSLNSIKDIYRFITIVEFIFLLLSLLMIYFERYVRQSD